MFIKKICVVTGSRAEYGLLYWLMKEISEDKDFELQLIVTGMHLSSEFGLTYKDIEKDFKIDKKIEMLVSSDTHIGVSKSMGLAQISFAETYEELQPDLLLVLGDRTEIFSAVVSAMISNIPIAHLHGGELTQGSVDEFIRHSITKMSHLHFTATEEYRKRVIQLGENPNRVFNVGSLGIENIKKYTLLNKEEFENSIDFKLNKKNILVTYHPETVESDNTNEIYFKELLDSLGELTDTNIIFTKANSDRGGRVINKMIDTFVMKNSDNCVSFSSLGQLRYFSALQYVDIVLGNSSSGLIEVPSFKTATINIGDRQKGRVCAQSVINIEARKNLILKVIQKVYSKSFQNILLNCQNPYEKDNSAETILNIIKSSNLKNIIKKSFYDL